MCGIDPISLGFGAATSLVQGASGFFSGQADAKAAKMEGRAAMADARSQAGALGTRAEYDVGNDRAGAAASGFAGDSAADALAAKAASYGLDIDTILSGGRARKAAADYSAKLSKRGAIGSLAGGFASAAGGVLFSKAGDWFGGGQGLKVQQPWGASMAGRGA